MTESPGRNERPTPEPGPSEISPTFPLKKYSLCAILVVLSVFLFVDGPDELSSRSFKHAWDAGHLIYFFVFTLLMVTHVNRIARLSTLRQWGAVFIITLFLGVLIEVLQMGVNRPPELGDVERDLLGSMAALVFVAPSRLRLPRAARIALKVLVVALLAASFVPLGIALYDEDLAVRRFPLLASFESPTELDRWRGNRKLSISNEVALVGGHSLKAMLSPVQSGFYLKYFPGDWKGFERLRVNLHSTAAHAFPLVCRIHDTEHVSRQQYYDDRFNRPFSISPGWNEIVIPLADVEHAPRERRMDMSRIVVVGFFIPQLSESVTVYLDDMRLEED